MIANLAVEDAGLLLDLLAGLSMGAWLAGARFTWKTLQMQREPRAGECVVAAPASAVRDALVDALSRAQQMSPLSLARITRADEDEVAWEVTRGPQRHRGIVRLAADGPRTRATYGIVGAGPLLRIAAAVCVAGLFVTVGLYLLLQAYVADSPDEHLRWQVFQMLQAVHLLWPPFLLAGLARKVRSQSAEEIERIVSNTGSGAGAAPAATS
jgi:hypothetical protein